MRCYECGYQNQSDAKVCVKCGTKLTSSGSGGPAQNNPATSSGDHGAATVRGKVASAPAWDGENSSPKKKPEPVDASILKCDACGYYPLRNKPASDSPCPNCGFKGSDESLRKEQSAPKSEKPKPAAPSGAKTMRIGQVNLSKEVPKPKLVLVDENKNTEQTYEGEEISLNRTNLAPENSSISSKEHAAFTHKDGKWTLEDKSSNGATFIQVKGKVMVESGSLIILGDKVFRVEISEIEE
ncbi:FHA domain-containing protein [Rhodohalobacter sp.]|uniref:FHA domain-containing protein n=1 Tax=Rhodohalobacter sp. TaxID=1974210 RepID=UPI0035622C30